MTTLLYNRSSYAKGDLSLSVLQNFDETPSNGLKLSELRDRPQVISEIVLRLIATQNDWAVNQCLNKMDLALVNIIAEQLKIIRQNPYIIHGIKPQEVQAFRDRIDELLNGPLFFGVNASVGVQTGLSQSSYTGDYAYLGCGGDDCRAHYSGGTRNPSEGFATDLASRFRLGKRFVLSTAMPTKYSLTEITDQSIQEYFTDEERTWRDSDTLSGHPFLIQTTPSFNLADRRLGRWGAQGQFDYSGYTNQIPDSEIQATEIDGSISASDFLQNFTQTSMPVLELSLGGSSGQTLYSEPTAEYQSWGYQQQQYQNGTVWGEAALYTLQHKFIDGRRRNWSITTHAEQSSEDQRGSSTNADGRDRSINLTVQRSTRIPGSHETSVKNSYALSAGWFDSQSNEDWFLYDWYTSTQETGTNLKLKARRDWIRGDQTAWSLNCSATAYLKQSEGSLNGSYPEGKEECGLNYTPSNHLSFSLTASHTWHSWLDGLYYEKSELDDSPYSTGNQKQTAHEEYLSVGSNYNTARWAVSTYAYFDATRTTQFEANRSWTLWSRFDVSRRLLYDTRSGAEAWFSVGASYYNSASTPLYPPPHYAFQYDQYSLNVSLTSKGIPVFRQRARPDRGPHTFVFHY